MTVCQVRVIAADEGALSYSLRSAYAFGMPNLATSTVALPLMLPQRDGFSALRGVNL